MNLNFLGGQPQMSGQSGMLQSFSQQQSGSNDSQLMQHHLMVKHMQELRKRHQLQQLEAMQRNALNHMPTFPNQLARQQSQPINGNPVQDTSDYPRQSHFTAGGTNWQQPEYPSAVQGHSNGLRVSPEQGQAMHFMGLIPQQSSQSLYGVPVSNTGDGNLFSQNFMDKSESFHLPAPNRSFSGNPYAPNAEQFSLWEANTASRSGSEGKISFDHGSSQGVENSDNPLGFYPNQQMQVLMSDGSGRGLFVSSVVSTEKSPMQPAASQPTSSQATVGLDPTEEEFLFGNDVNIWEAFGEVSTAGNDGGDLFNGLPSVQSGTWSALMQSAVAETCSSDVEMKEEWGGLESQNSRSQSENQPLSTSQDNEKPPSVKVGSLQGPSFGLKTINNDVSTNNASLNGNNSHNFRFPQAFSNQRSSPTESQVLQDGRRWLDSDVHESSQRPPDHHNLEVATKSGIVGSGIEQINMNKGQSVFVDRSVNSPGGVAEIHVIENGDGRENLNDSHQHNFPNHALASNSRENLWSNASDRQFIPGPPEIASGYACEGVPVPRMFQYQPTGDVDESSPSSRHKVQEVRQTLVAPAGSSLSNMEKGKLSGVSGDAAMLHGSLSSSIHPGHSLDKSAPFVRSGGTFSPSQHPSQSQNMLELLHKVDQSKDQNIVSDLGSTNYYRSSDTSAGGNIGPGQSQSSTSNEFNFQLALPSRGIDLSNLNDPAQSSFKSFGSPRSRLVSSEQGDNKSGHLDGSQSKPKGFLSACSTSNAPSLRDPFQNSCTTVEGGQRMGDLQSSIVSPDGHTYHDQQSTDFQSQAVSNQLVVSNLDNNFASARDKNQSGIRPPMHQMPPSMLAVMAGMRKDKMLDAQACNSSEILTPGFQSNDASDVNSFSQQKKDELDGPRSTNAVNSQGVASGHGPIVEDPRFFGKTARVSQEDSLGRQSMESSPSNSAASQKHADVFHHSLKPSNVQVMKTIDMDTSHQESQSLRGLENGPDATQISISSRDAKMLSFTPHSGNRSISPQLLHGAAASHDMLSLGHNVSQKYVNGNITSRAQLAGIIPHRPQMAPSWFEQYGAFRNGQLLPVHNVPSFPMMKNVEQQFSKPPSNMVLQNTVHLENGVTDANKIGNTSQITNVARGQTSSLQAFVPSTSPTPLSIRPKKRKTATSELIPWNEEIGNCFKKMQNISSAEVDWAQSSNRLAERGEDAIDSGENMSPIVKSRRRLILTTKLMQQIFPPPSASVLSLDGRSNYEAIVYSVARSSLGDACNLICSVKSDSAPNNGNSMTKTSGKICDQYISKFIEEFTNKAKELENDLLRLDNRASILDFRLDSQELERFSVINRFAKFHGRKQVDRFGTSSSSDANALSSQRCTQKYFTAHPMPSTVPERVQCLTIN